MSYPEKTPKMRKEGGSRFGRAMSRTRTHVPLPYLDQALGLW